MIALDSNAIHNKLALLQSSRGKNNPTFDWNAYKTFIQASVLSIATRNGTYCLIDLNRVQKQMQIGQ